MPFVPGQPISAPQGPLCASSSTIRPLEGTHAPLLPSPEPNARVFTATPTSPLSLSRFARGEAPGTDIRVLQEEPHMEEVAGWTADLEPTAGPKSLLRGTAPGTVGSVGWPRVPRHLGHRRGHWGNSCEPAAPALRICARGLGWAAEEPSRMDPPQQETSPPGHFRSPMPGTVRGDVSITAAQVLPGREGAGGVPGSPSTADQDTGCWDGEFLPPRLSGHHSYA